MIALNVNGKAQQVDVEPDTPLLWVLRDSLDLTGTKYGCGIAQCGACTVHMDGQPVRSCVTPVTAAAGKKIVTIEGLDARGEHPLQKETIDRIGRPLLKTSDQQAVGLRTVFAEEPPAEAVKGGDPGPVVGVGELRVDPARDLGGRGRGEGEDQDP